MVARPLEPHELLDRCDLAGEATVRAIENRDGGSARYARLRILKIAKGKIEQSPDAADGTVWVRLRDEPTMGRGGAILGSWNDKYPVGARVLTHLCWSEDESAYRTLWWNAILILTAGDGTAGISRNER